MSKRLNPISVSVVIPNYNGKLLLQKHLPSVIKAVGQKSEIIVVDDDSSDDSVAFVQEKYPFIKIIRFQHNQRFAAACNAGVTAAINKIVVLLNNDVTPSIDFLNHLISDFNDSEVFAVGCKEIDTNKEVSGKSCGRFEKGFLAHWRCNNQTSGESLWVSGGSAAFRKAYWHRLGGLDPLFKPAYLEDIDICYRALKRGWKVLYNQHSVVFHNHETTNQSAFGQKGINIASYKNNCIFVWKNITDRKLLISHLKWLPYHLIITGYKTKGQFIIGFIQALTKLPYIYAKRVEERRQSVFKDKLILSQVNDKNGSKYS